MTSPSWEKRPFQDADEMWWVYRSDDESMHSPMGPFFTQGFALEQEQYARDERAPIPLSLAHRQPRKPLRPPPKPPPLPGGSISYRSRAWDGTDGINYND